MKTKKKSLDVVSREYIPKGEMAIRITQYNKGDPIAGVWVSMKSKDEFRDILKEIEDNCSFSKKENLKWKGFNISSYSGSYGANCAVCNVGLSNNNYTLSISDSYDGENVRVHEECIPRLRMIP